MLLLNNAGSADAITGTKRKAAKAGTHYLAIQATDYDSVNVNVLCTVNGMEFKIKQTDGTDVSDVGANATYLVTVPRGAELHATVGDPVTGTVGVYVGLFDA